MKLLKGMGIGLCLVILCLLVAPKSKADEQGSKTVVTFTVPVEVPGVGVQTLPAGTYLFKSLDSSPDRDIIQISNPDGTHVYTTFVGVPNSRLKAPDLITVMFTDRPAADPQALKAWYCPGRTWGDQVVYQQPRATQLAKETNEPVLSTSVVLAAASIEVLKTAPIGAVGPTGETVALAQVVDAPPGDAPAVAPALAVAAGTTASPAPVAAVEPVAAVASPSAPATTVAVASAPAAETVTATEPTVAAEPAVAVVPPPAPAPTVAAEPVVAPAPVAVAEPVAPPVPTVKAEPTVAASPEVSSATLPQTASLLPLIGLVGLLMLGAAFLLTSLMKRRV